MSPPTPSSEPTPPRETAPRARPFVIGVTGPVAAGKTRFVVQLGGHGWTLIDVDALGHQALELPEVVAAVVADFGAEMLAVEGELDRAAVARRVYSDDDALARLEALVHPPVRRWIDEALAAAPADRPAVLDVALLFESGLDSICDMTVCVTAPESNRIARAMRSRGWTADELRSRAAHQLSAEEKAARATRVVRNDGTIQRLAAAAAALVEEFTPPAGRDRA